MNFRQTRQGLFLELCSSFDSMICLLMGKLGGPSLLHSYFLFLQRISYFTLETQLRQGKNFSIDFSVLDVFWLNHYKMPVALIPPHKLPEKKVNCYFDFLIYRLCVLYEFKNIPTEFFFITSIDFLHISLLKSRWE